MKTLSATLRRQLERAVADARDVAEAGARAALESLAVRHREPYAHMTPEERKRRQRLRAHGRQLGDRRDARTGTQAIDRLVHECAYEHWHGMLFARFLAENHLLIEQELSVAVTLDECEELAKEKGMDKWAMAARFAHRMLPQVFRPDHPAFEVSFAREHRLKLEELVESLPTSVFTATDSLGWVYQFWQSRKKTEVNRSGIKIGADELPAVTQLFTEPYMVSFLLDNALGAWWAGRRLSETELTADTREAELRRKAAIPGLPLDYLRFVHCEDTAGRTEWRPAAGTFDSWPDDLGELRVLDPCCGSGHFLVAALSMLVPMRIAREGLAARDAVDAVLRENLHGLELDSRCVELAAFALALAAWTYPGGGGYRSLPELNIACSGLSVGTAKERWTELAEGRHNLRIALDWMHVAFRDAPVLGSLLNPAATEAAKLMDWRDLSVALTKALAREESDERRETAVAARGLARAAELLSGRYHWVITNVPYLARGKQGQTLRRFCEQRYTAAKNDLATVFLERCLELCTRGGTASLVLPQNWLFLSSYRKLREKLLKTETWHMLARLGEGGFDSPAAAGAFVALLTLSRHNPAGHPGGLFGEETADGRMCGMDVSEARTAGEKAVRLAEEAIQSIEQARNLTNPDARVAFEEVSRQLLGEIAGCWQGIVSSDDNKFVSLFWEIHPEESRWEWLQLPPQKTKLFTGRTGAIRWERGSGMLHTNSNAHNFPSSAMLERPGVAFQRMRELNATLFSGSIFADHVAPVVPNSAEVVAAIWCWATSPESKKEIRKVDSTLKAAVGSFIKAPFDLVKWTRIAHERYPNGIPHPYSDDPTQWIFHGHPCGSVVWDEVAKWTAHGPHRIDPTVLQVAVARLLGYRWPAELDADMELADEQREWVRRCNALLAYADEDGIVCIPSVRGEPPASDRVLDLLAAAYDDAWDNDVLKTLLSKTGSLTLDDWLRNRFFGAHCKTFHHRPFVWHVWDGRRNDGFHALINYHKLAAGDGNGRRLLESLTYSYLGDWIARQQDGVKRGEGGAEDRLTAALELQKRLVAIIAGEPPCDIFVRWKPMEDQPIGWEPDINDGVRLNIRPFMAEDILGGMKGAGILRAKPNIHWRNDRGKEPIRAHERFPWFWSNDEFIGRRVNDVHMTSAEKLKHRRQELGKECRSNDRRTHASSNVQA